MTTKNGRELKERDWVYWADDPKKEPAVVTRVTHYVNSVRFNALGLDGRPFCLNCLDEEVIVMDEKPDGAWR